jgi:hypothetical protein
MPTVNNKPVPKIHLYPIFDKIFKEYDAIKNQDHFHNLANWILICEKAEKNCKPNYFFHPSSDYSVEQEYLNAHKEEWMAKTNKYQAILKDCQSHIDEIINNLKPASSWDSGLFKFNKAITCFIEGKTSNSNIYDELREDLMKDGKVEIRVLVALYPYKSKFKKYLPVDGLCYILCGISPEDYERSGYQTGYNSSFSKIIGSINEMLKETNAVRKTIRESHFSWSTNEVKAEELIKEIKEKYPEFLEFFADWMKQKIENVEENTDCTEEKLSDYELVQKSIKSMTLESGKSIFTLQNKEKIIEEILKHMEGDIFKLASGAKVKVSKTSLGGIVTILRGSEKSKYK